MIPCGRGEALIPSIANAIAMVCVAAVWAWAPVDSAAVEAERAQCKQGCASIESSTDRSTCELTCDSRADNKLDGPSIESWKTEKRMGGPPPGVPVGYEDGHSGSVTTTVRTDASGTHESVSTTGRKPTTTAPKDPPRPAVVRTPSPAFAARAPLAKCQARCDAEATTKGRLLCKAQCLRSFPTPPSFRHRTPAARPSPGHDR